MKLEKDNELQQNNQDLLLPMEDIKPQEGPKPLQCKRKGNSSADLTLVIKKGADSVLSNPMFGLEICIESMYSILNLKILGNLPKLFLLTEKSHLPSRVPN